jgi:hypothetical protein
MVLDLEKKRIVDLGMMKIVDLVEVKNKHSYLVELLPSHSVAVSYFPVSNSFTHISLCTIIKIKIFQNTVYKQFFE